MGMVNSVARRYWNEVLDLRAPIVDDRRERRSTKPRRRQLVRKVLRVGR